MAVAKFKIGNQQYYVADTYDFNEWNGWEIQFATGGYSSISVLVLEYQWESEAMDEAVDVLGELGMMGLSADAEVGERYQELMAEGYEQEAAWEESEQGTFRAGNASHAFNGHEVGMIRLPRDSALFQRAMKMTKRTERKSDRRGQRAPLSKIIAYYGYVKIAQLIALGDRNTIALVRRMDERQLALLDQAIDTGQEPRRNGSKRRRR